jgi:hypothetical protein
MTTDANAPDGRDLEEIYADLLPLAERGQHLTVVDRLAQLVERQGRLATVGLTSRFSRGAALRVEHLDAAEALAELRLSWIRQDRAEEPRAAIRFFGSLAQLSPRHANAWFWINQDVIHPDAFRGLFDELVDHVLPQVCSEEYLATTHRVLESLGPEPADPVGRGIYRRFLARAGTPEGLRVAGLLLAEASRARRRR